MHEQRLLELRAQDPSPFNHPIAVFSEWRGKAFYLNVRYRARSRRPEDDFVVRHTRMTLTGFGRFDLAYFRHTDNWFTVYRALTAAECFREIEENEVFWPTTCRLQGECSWRRSRIPLTNIWPACPLRTALRSRRCVELSMLQHPGGRSESATGCPRSS
jgi:hypothetical protein